MISPEILNVLKSNQQEPSYAVMITDFESIQNCNNNKLIITTEQINPHPLEIIKEQHDIIENLKKCLIDNEIDMPNSANAEREINSIIEKKLMIESVLDYDVTSAMFTSQLKGSISNEHSIDIEKTSLSGTISNGIVKITEKDYPNYFNKAKFRIKNNTLIISIPQQINNIEILLKSNNNTNILRTINDVSNNKISIPLVENNYTFDISYSFDQDVLMKNIESITTPFRKKIELEFNYKYKTIPSVIITIDSNNKNYETYDLLFNTDEDDYYTGVVIDFKISRNKIKDNDINIIIIGDKIA